MASRTFSHPLLRPLATLASAIAVAVLLHSCGADSPRNGVVVSVKDQKMLLVKNGSPIKTYPVSTSKFGCGDHRGSYCTPIGKMAVAKKIGRGAPAGAVFKSRRRTGEILRPDAPGRDPIVTRILWLKGTGSTRNAFRRYIYIHGTPEERNIGKRASYGCIRMKSKDVIDLYRHLAVGSKVHVIRGGLARTEPGKLLIAQQAAAQAAKQPAGGE
ncbi:MAG: L,D-transpeptidase family protein [Akkermansiaceae bacterium]